MYFLPKSTNFLLFILLSVFSLIVLLTPLLEKSLIVHLFILIPVLIFLGFLLGRYCILEPRFMAKWNQTGVPLLVLASLTFVFWMIPRFLDASLQDNGYYLFKIISLPLLCGLPLAWSYNKASYITFNFFRIEFIATLFRMAWLFITAKERLCLNYLYSEQAMVGKLFLFIAIAFSLWPAFRVIFGHHNVAYSKLTQEIQHAK